MFLAGHILLLSSDLNKLGTTNGFPQAENAPVCLPTSGHQMAEKMRLGRQDHGDNDTGKTLISHTQFLLEILPKHWDRNHLLKLI